MNSADVGENHCLLGADSVRNWYRSLLEGGMLYHDDDQAAAVELLQQLASRIVAPKQQEGLIARLLGSSAAEAGGKESGLYIYGTVGRGKSFLMDGFFLNLPVEDKMRVHFHGFMRHFHADMAECCGADDALATVAARLSARWRVICFDEFHVSDIADAMILGRLLELLLADGVVLVATSNYAPADLYPNGLARDRFLPAIELLENRLQVHNLDGGTDYRLRTLVSADRFLTPDSRENRERLEKMFNELSADIRLTPSVKLGSRRIDAQRRSSTTVWFEFAQLCEGKWAQADYLRLAERFATVFLSGVPKLEEGSEAARRFTWLVDVLYDERIKLIVCAAASLDQLFADGGGESGRTLSRLREMQSVEYLKAPLRRGA